MKNLTEQYIDIVKNLILDIENTQNNAIKDAAKIIADSIVDGGIVQAFGSGHSYAAAIEIAGRAGGLIPTKAIIEPSTGMYEMVEGVGTQFFKTLEVSKQDCFVLISNSGRNPLHIEIALKLKELGNKIIVVTSLESSKKLSSRHSSGYRLFELADVVIDNRVNDGDATIQLDYMDVKVGPVSSIATGVIMNCMTLSAIEIMKSRSFVPPVYMSANVDGGPEFNEIQLAKYKHRIVGASNTKN